ncbi:MAG: carboxylating nicotinate-nucleotide diphosphorylase [Calditrichia bacterium]|nr:carboxylating nicotinate-nucleotide diphosphorylase [Calditrichia bacterium]
MELEELLVLALYEDIGTGDITSLATVGFDKTGKAKIIAKQDGVLCGIEIVQKVFNLVDKQLKIQIEFQDGQQLTTGNIVMKISGLLHSILQGERVALNILGHLSGVATQTNLIVKNLSSQSKLKILDTRKTAPLWRKWQKYAVKTGGGQNHRFGLYDMILIKENHMQAAGSLENAIERSINYRKQQKQNWKIEIEVKNLEELKRVLKYPVDIVMLDNMSPTEIKHAVDITPQTVKLEVSGGIIENIIPQYASLGVDYISMGALTHSVTNFDFSLLVE